MLDDGILEKASRDRATPRASLNHPRSLRYRHRAMERWRPHRRRDLLAAEVARQRTRPYVHALARRPEHRLRRIRWS